MSVDPMGINGGDVNLYRYVMNSPLVFADPLGLFQQFMSYFGVAGQQMHRETEALVGAYGTVGGAATAISLAPLAGAVAAQSGPVLGATTLTLSANPTIIEGGAGFIQGVAEAYQGIEGATSAPMSGAETLGNILGQAVGEAGRRLCE